MALLAAAVRASRASAGFVLGLISLMDCCRAAGTEGVAVDVSVVGDAVDSSAVCDFVVTPGSLS